MINADRTHARTLVAKLHELAQRTHGTDAETIEQAACALDECQAGLALYTPHPATGHALVTTAQRAQILDIETPAALEAA